ncbi:hypothetical protein CDD83_9626 [Cordyceps sp. RAO-2017]|nr:hypothetical protein CDD83_9626 [Cordyceps sp. RAO-2017]
MDKTQRKSERSHEENQERAYIAASRRADRSIEARVQSARMASEIHKKRTGKGFRITEDIVMKEEMYEEEDEDLYRSYRLLGSHLQTGSPEFNSRIEAFLTNKVAMSTLLARTNEEWRENEINKLFAQSFPNADQQAQQLCQGMPGNMYNMPPPSPAERPVVFQSVTYVPRSRHRSQARSRSVASHACPGSPVAPMTPNSNPPTPATRTTSSSIDSAMGPETPMDFGPAGASAFTTELPPEAKMLMGGLPMDPSFGQFVYDHDWTATPACFDFGQTPRDMKVDDAHPQEAVMPEYFPQDYMSPFTPNAGLDESWDAFIDETSWVGE